MYLRFLLFYLLVFVSLSGFVGKINFLSEQYIYAELTNKRNIVSILSIFGMFYFYYQFKKQIKKKTDDLAEKENQFKEKQNILSQEQQLVENLKQELIQKREDLAEKKNKFREKQNILSQEQQLVENLKQELIQKREEYDKEIRDSLLKNRYIDKYFSKVIPLIENFCEIFKRSSSVFGSKQPEKKVCFLRQKDEIEKKLEMLLSLWKNRDVLNNPVITYDFLDMTSELLSILLSYERIDKFHIKTEMQQEKHALNKKVELLEEKLKAKPRKRVSEKNIIAEICDKHEEQLSLIFSNLVNICNFNILVKFENGVQQKVSENINGYITRLSEYVRSLEEQVNLREEYQAELIKEKIQLQKQNYSLQERCCEYQKRDDEKLFIENNYRILKSENIDLKKKNEILISVENKSINCLRKLIETMKENYKIEIEKMKENYKIEIEKMEIEIKEIEKRCVNEKDEFKNECQINFENDKNILHKNFLDFENELRLEYEKKSAELLQKFSEFSQEQSKICDQSLKLFPFFVKGVVLSDQLKHNPFVDSWVIPKNFKFSSKI